MADGTPIEWTDATWNPITGCSVHSAGCTNCYAMKLAGTRLQHHESRKGLTVDTKAGPVWNGEVRFNEAWLTEPLRWKRPRRIFVVAHGDLFHEAVPDAWIDRVFAVMALCPQHQFQVLTKRADRMREYVTAWHERVRANGELGLGLPGKADDLLTLADLSNERLHIENVAAGYRNIWLGVSVEDQRAANERIPDLLSTPAAVRWVSAEPLLGPLDLTDHCNGHYFQNFLTGERWHDAPEGQHGARDHQGGRLDWVVAGGESGPGARPMHPDWVRDLRDQCAAAGVPFLFKQWGGWTPGENVERRTGWVNGAHWFDNRWLFEEQNLAATDGHIDDEPDLYLVGKKAAGRMLDGQLHDGFPA
ncbi:phage Gp37/Gp68 family protein [Sphingomonadaceae bacterium G21617-S1]|nr:phage Gp37/Gp68 family protein [Sphingomonadaceae bacterium G21617-S1]